MSQKCLVIPDIHQKWEIAQRIIESVEHDILVCLGDYFDDFVETPDRVRRTAEWLAKTIEQDNNILLAGNHCLSYAFPPTQYTQCSGYTPEKRFIINSIMTGPGYNHWKNLKFFTAEQGWIISHAGFHPALVGNNYSNDPLGTIAEMQAAADSLRIALEAGTNHPWLAVSRYRGGYDYYGGPFWLDAREFPRGGTGGMKQLAGHTPGSSVRKIELPDGTLSGVIIDTHLKNYCLIEDGQLRIRKTPVAWLHR